MTTPMDNERKRPIQLEPKRSAGELLAQQQAVHRFTATLNGIKRRQRMIFRSETADFAAELRELLADLNTANPDPKTGIQLLVKFFEADGKIVNQCDDSDGAIGDVYQIDAQQLFDAYAAACPDKEWLCQVLLKLCAVNDYGLRDYLLDHAELFLPANLLRQLAESFLRLGQRELKTYKEPWQSHASHYLILVETIARRLKDPEFFERVHLMHRDGGRASWFEVAEAYLEAGDTANALDRVGRESGMDRGTAGNRDELLLKIHKARGDRKAMAAAAGRLFHADRSKIRFDRLIELVGEAERGRILAESVEIIQGNQKFDLGDALFMAEMGETAAAEAYILKHVAHLDGNEYYSLPQLADQLAEAGHPLGAAVIFRALVEANLAPALSKYYRYGVRYLRDLDEVASAVTDWGSFKPHPEYLEYLRIKHARKSRFWELYEKSLRRG